MYRHKNHIHTPEKFSLISAAIIHVRQLLMCGNFHENTVGEKVKFHCQAGNIAAAKTLREQGIIKVVNKKIKIMSVV